MPFRAGVVFCFSCLCIGVSQARACRVASSKVSALGDALSFVQLGGADAFRGQPPRGVAEAAGKPRRRIPRILMQTDATSAKEASLRDEWLRANPGWEYTFLNDTSGMAFLRGMGEEYSTAFDTLIPGAMKADFLRLAWLYKHGGAYMDVDNKPGRLENFTNVADIVIPKSMGNGDCVGHMYNAVMMAVPGSKFIKRALDIALKRVKTWWKDDCGNCQKTCYGIAGPTLLGKEVCRATPRLLSKRPRRIKESCTFNGGSVSGDGCMLPLNTALVMNIGESIYILEERANDFSDKRDGTPFATYEAQCWQGRIYKGDLPEE